MNRSKAKLGKGADGTRLVREIHILPDSSTYFQPYWPDHQDPDFANRTYGDDAPQLMSFMQNLGQGDWVWFIESVSVTSYTDWGYHVVYGFDVEAHYFQNGGMGDWKDVSEDHIRRLSKSAHYPIWKNDCVVILGKEETSRDLFKKPLRISVGEDPYPWLKEAMGISITRELTGYWFKKVFGERVTRAILDRI